MLDAKEQMALAELLTQLSKAALAVKRLEKMAGDVWVKKKNEVGDMGWDREFGE